MKPDNARLELPASVVCNKGVGAVAGVGWRVDAPGYNEEDEDRIDRDHAKDEEVGKDVRSEERKKQGAGEQRRAKLWDEGG